MAKIILTRGLPGSGKSTWAQAYAGNHVNHVIVERDDLRMQLFGSYWTGKQEDEERVTRLQEKLVRAALSEDMTVIVSDTHLPDRSVKKWLKLGHELGVSVEVKDFRHVPLAVCLGRNAVRDDDKVVPVEVVEDKYNRFIKGRDLSKVVEYTPAPKATIEPYVQPPVPAYPRLNAVIFDIDGTLAVMGDRSPYDGAAVWKDTPNHDVATALMMHVELQHTVYIVSGRDEIYRDVTEKWLDSHGIKYDALLMRPTEEGNKREDSIIKHELFNKHISPLGYRILGVYDDRHRVLRMWRELGLTTFHVNGPDAGNF